MNAALRAYWRDIWNNMGANKPPPVGGGSPAPETAHLTVDESNNTMVTDMGFGAPTVVAGPDPIDLTAPYGQMYPDGSIQSENDQAGSYSGIFPNGDVHMHDGTHQVIDKPDRIQRVSPNGTKWNITVTDDGTLNIVAV